MAKKKSDPFAALLASIPGGGGGGGNKGGNNKGGGNKGGSNKGGGNKGGSNKGGGGGGGTVLPYIQKAWDTVDPGAPAQPNLVQNPNYPGANLIGSSSSTTNQANQTNQLAGGPSDGSLDIGLGEYNAATTGYEWDARKAIAKLQEDAATERLKYEVDNRIPLTEAEYKGKIDLQKIVNAGNRRVANIQRGSQMFASMMGAFNF